MPRKSTARGGSSARERTASPAHLSHAELESMNVKELHELHKTLHSTAGPAKKADLVDSILTKQKEREVEEDDRDELDTISERQSATPRTKRKRTSISPVVEVPVITSPQGAATAAGGGSGAAAGGGSGAPETPAKRPRKTVGRTPKLSRGGLNLNAAAAISEEEQSDEIQVLEHRTTRAASIESDDSGATQTPARNTRSRSKEPSEAPPTSAARKARVTEHIVSKRTSLPAIAERDNGSSAIEANLTLSGSSRASRTSADKSNGSSAPALAKKEVEEIIAQAIESRKKELEDLIHASSEMHTQTIARIEAELQKLDQEGEQRRNNLLERFEALEKTTADSSERDALEKQLRKEMTDLSTQTKKTSDELLSALDRLITSKASSDEVKAIRNSINTQIQTNVGLQSEQNGIRSQVEALTREIRAGVPQQELLKMLDDLSAVQQREHGELRKTIDQGATNFNLLKANLGQTNQQLSSLRAGVESSASQTQLDDATARLTRLASEQGRLAAKADLFEGELKDKATLADVAKLQGAVEKQARDVDAAVGALENRMLAVQDASTSTLKQEMRGDIESLRSDFAGLATAQTTQEQRLQAVRSELAADFEKRISQAVADEANSSDARHQAALQTELRRLTEKRDEQLTTQLDLTRQSVSAEMNTTIEARLRDVRADFESGGARMISDAEKRLRESFGTEMQSARADLDNEIAKSRALNEEAARKSEAATAELKATAHIHILNSSDLRDRLKMLVRNEVAPIERKVQQTNGLAEYTASMVNDFEKMVDERVALRLSEHHDGATSTAGPSNGTVKALERMVAQLSADLRETQLELRNLKRERQSVEQDEEDDPFEAEEDEERPARISSAAKPDRKLLAEETGSFSPMQAFKWVVGLDAKQPSTPTAGATNGNDVRLTRSTVKKQRRM